MKEVPHAPQELSRKKQEGSRDNFSYPCTGKDIVVPKNSYRERRGPSPIRSTKKTAGVNPRPTKVRALAPKCVRVFLTRTRKC